MINNDGFLKLVNLLKSDENSIGGMTSNQLREYDRALADLSKDFKNAGNQLNCNLGAQNDGTRGKEDDDFVPQSLK